jgi:DNA sulfur modification protein DndC
MRSFYEPTDEHLAKLSGPWCCSYSGGKDSTSLVTWIEWLRRSGQIDVARPQLVQSDTTVEYPILQSISRDMTQVLTACGWECALVEPLLSEKLYNRILGIGNTPIHAGIRSMRWCTRSTKIDPMDRWRAVHSSGLTMTGLRLGESTMRDGKIKKRGCAAGGECGIPEASERTYSPILRWSTCHVIDWLNGHVRRDIQSVLADVFAISKKLVEVYDVEVDRDVFEWSDPIVTAARFGCIGCPAIQAERHAPRSSIERHGTESPLNELYDVWFEARRRANRIVRRRANRIVRRRAGGNEGYGPIKMEVRKVLFARVMDIQRRAGIVLITPDDEAFIRQCWVDKVYPRGWSEADEATEPPSETPLFVVATAG